MNASPRSTNRPRTRKRAAKTSWVQRLRRRDLVLLTGALSLACFSVIVVGLLILRFQTQPANSMAGPTSTPGPQPTHTVTFMEVTGLSQYRLAQAAAVTWAPDAQLVSASASWPGVLNLDQIGQPAVWSYHFYSPEKQRLYVIRVDPDGQINAFKHIRKITLPPPILATDTWVIDSPAALAVWLDHGGAKLVQRNPGLEVLIQLRTLKNQPNPVWMVIGSDKRTGDLHIVAIEAGEGKVISTSSAGG